jgi:uncharacterized ion transporter superfamily protein YfcC
MESRRQLAMQRKAEEEKAKVLEEERKMKEEAERRKKEREPIKYAVKKKVLLLFHFTVLLISKYGVVGG